MNTVKIGRSSDNDIIYTEDAISRHHCELYCSNKKVFIKDLNSSNGTKVNGIKIDHPVWLKKGDKVELGRVVCIDWYEIWTSFYGDNIVSNNELETIKQDTHSDKPVSDKKNNPIIEIPPSIHIKQDHADVMKKGNDGADFKVPFLRNFGDRMGNLLGSTAGCIGSILMVLAFMTIMGLIISTCS